MDKLGVMALRRSLRSKVTEQSKKGERDLLDKRATIVIVPRGAGTAGTRFPGGKLRWNKLSGSFALVIMSPGAAIDVHIPHGNGRLDAKGEIISTETTTSMVGRMLKSLAQAYSQAKMTDWKQKPKAYLLAPTAANPDAMVMIGKAMRKMGLKLKVQTYTAEYDCGFSLELEGDGKSEPRETISRNGSPTNYGISNKQ